MSVTLQEVLKTDTLEIQRQKFNTLAQDTFNVLAGGTNLSAGTVGIADGTLSSPALYFNSETPLGLYKPSDYNLTFVADNQELITFGDLNYSGSGSPNLTISLKKPLNSLAENAIDTFALTPGSGYTAGNYYNIPLNQDFGIGFNSGTQGIGATADILVTGIIGSVTSFGTGGFKSGSYEGIPFVNVSRTADLLSGTTNNVGSGYVDNTYTNVLLTGGSGSGARATITVSNTEASSVVITSGGSGYQITDLLGVNGADLGAAGGFGLEWEVTSVITPAFGGLANIEFAHFQGSFQPGSGYQVGSYENVPLTGGSGTGAKADFIVQQLQSFSGTAQQGSGYTLGSYPNLNVFNTPTTTYTVTTVGGVYYIDGNTQPMLTLVPGNTYRFDISDSTNAGHDFYIDGVPAPGGGFQTLPSTISYIKSGSDASSYAFVDLIIDPSHVLTTDITYQCTVHPSMGGDIEFTTGVTGSYGTGLTVSTSVINGNLSGEVSDLVFSGTRIKAGFGNFTGFHTCCTALCIWVS